MFFVSLTLLSQPHHAPWLWRTAIDAAGLRTVVTAHLFWAASILVNELDQFLSSKSAELDDLRKELIQMSVHGGFRYHIPNMMSLLGTILYAACLPSTPHSDHHHLLLHPSLPPGHLQSHS